MDVATAMYYTGINPLTMKEVHVARGMRDRRLQRSLLQFFKPENYFLVCEALRKAGRSDLIGHGKECLVPPHPPREAVEARRRSAQKESGDIHRMPVGKGRRDDRRQRDGQAGYRPGRVGGSE